MGVGGFVHGAGSRIGSMVCMFVILSGTGGKFFRLISMSADFTEPFYLFQYLPFVACGE